MKEKFILLKEKLHNSRFYLPVREILLAILVNLAVEMLSRRSVVAGLSFILTHPIQFVYGALIVLFTFSFTVLVKRKIFLKTLICGLWFVCGVVNFIVSSFRHTPFTAQDFRLIKYAYTVAPLYLSSAQIVLIIVMAVVFIAAMIVWWIKAPKYQEKINYFKGLVVILSFWFVVWGSTRMGQTFGVFARNFGNIGDAYDEYGFAYCFTSSLLNSGIDKPKDYSEETIKEILSRIEQYESEREQDEAEQEKEFDIDSNDGNASNHNEIKGDNEKESNPEKAESEEEGTEATDMEKADIDETVPDENGITTGEEENTGDGWQDVAASKDYPNIIFLQLESLFNPELLKDVQYSATVLPTLQWLYTEYSSGFLSVPSVGAGTANTEFEVISGMNLNDFGPGEYPYKTVLMHSACESICYDLKKYGYTTNAIHDNDGTFYDRNVVFAQLGFDTFTSIEYMNDVELNELGWADDSILTDEILEVLNASEGRDFIYTISVQGHGDYPAEYEIKMNDIIASGDAIDEFIQPFTYYVNQVNEMDKFVGELISALRANGEPVVLVMYGDHLPAFDITDEELKEGNIYTTQYAIWDNIGLTKINEDIEAFQLTSHVLDMLGIEGGAISKYHSTIRRIEEQEEYLEGLRILEYDILYGDKDVYGGQLPYSQTNLQMGHKNISIKKVSNADNHVVITGENFTEYSCVMINGEYVDSIFSNSSLILLDGISLLSGDSVAVVQKGKDGVKLSSTSLFIYR